MVHAAHRFWKTAAVSASSLVGESPLFLADYLLRFLRVVVLLSLWRMVFTGRGEVSGMTLPALLTYTLVAEVYADVLAVRTELGNALWDGSIANRLLQPAHLAEHFAAEMAGRWLFNFCFFSVPLLGCAPWLGVTPLPPSLQAALLFIVSLALGTAVGLALEFIWGALSVGFEQSLWMVDQLRAATAALLSGALIPLALFPWGIGRVFEWLPFASTASAPLRIYTGTGDPLPLLGAQAAWALVLWPLAGWMWRIYRERLVCYGG